MIQAALLRAAFLVMLAVERGLQRAKQPSQYFSGKIKFCYARTEDEDMVDYRGVLFSTSARLAIFIVAIIFCVSYAFVTAGQVVFTRPAILAVVGFTATHNGNFTDVIAEGGDIALDKFCSDQFPGSLSCRHNNFTFTGVQHRLDVFNGPFLPAWVSGWQGSCRADIDGNPWVQNSGTGKVMSKGSETGSILTSEEETCNLQLPVACCSYQEEDVFTPP